MGIQGVPIGSIVVPFWGCLIRSKIMSHKEGTTMEPMGVLGIRCFCECSWKSHRVLHGGNRLNARAASSAQQQTEKLPLDMLRCPYLLGKNVVAGTAPEGELFNCGEHEHGM